MTQPLLAYILMAPLVVLLLVALVSTLWILYEDFGARAVVASLSVVSFFVGLYLLITS